MKNFLAEVFLLDDSNLVNLPANVYTSREFASGKPPFGIVYQRGRHLHFTVGTTTSSKYKLILE
jgi:hypothetical protein